MRKSDAEKVAEKLLNLTKDSTLDLEQVGVYLAKSYPAYLTTRLEYILEVARDEKKESEFVQHDTLF